MARTRPTAAPPSGAKNPPHEESNKKNESTSEQSSHQIGAPCAVKTNLASSDQDIGKSTIGSETRRHHDAPSASMGDRLKSHHQERQSQEPRHRTSDGDERYCARRSESETRHRHRQDASSPTTKPSAPAPRIEHSRNHQQDHRSNGSRYDTSDRGGGYGTRGSGRDYHSRDHYYRNRSNQHRKYSDFDRRSEIRDQNYYRRSDDDRRWSEPERHYERGRDREPPRDHYRYEYHSHDRRERSEDGRGDNYYREQEFMRHREKRSRHDRGDGSSRYYGSDPSRKESQSHHVSGRRPEYDSVPTPRNDRPFQSENTLSQPVHPPPATSRDEIMKNEKLKQQLKREELETRIVRERLEREIAQRKLSQLRQNDAVNSENVEGSLVARHGTTTTVVSQTNTKNATQSENVPARLTANQNSKPSSNGTSERGSENLSANSPAEQSTGRNDDTNVEESEVVPPSMRAEHDSTTNNVAASRTRHSLDGVGDHGDSARRKSPNTVTDQNAKSTSASQTAQTNKSKRRTTRGNRKLSASTKRKLREAQLANDEQKKHEMLKAYEEEMVARKSKNMHPHTEKDLMSSWTPEIVDHYLMHKGYGKFLVKWVASSKKGKRRADNEDTKCCLSWISHENFLFPTLAQRYLSQKIKSKTCHDDFEWLKLWIENCEERERCLNCLNTFDAGDEELTSLLEIDFCCYLCKCPWDHPLKRSIRNCEAGLKYHRPCCHGYRDYDSLESFVSPVGKVQMELLEHLGEATSDSEEGKNEPSTTQITSHVTSMADGNCEKYMQCLHSRLTSKRDPVVLCINAGIGSSTVSLKHLGVKMSKIIHVEGDPVAQHVIRSNHDYGYGEIDDEDQIEHVVGLYDSSNVVEDPKRLVRKHGPIDIVICMSPQGKSREESVSFASVFFDYVGEIVSLNKELHNFDDDLFYLFECDSSIEDHLPQHELSYCICENEKMYLCNWPLLSQKSSMLRPKTDVDKLALPNGYVMDSVTNLYASLREALCVGFGDSKWTDELNPKYWEFVSLGPTGYDVKLNKGEFGPEAFSLRLRNPGESEVLTDMDYSNYLLGRASSVGLLHMLLQPMKNLFNEKNYGPLYSAMTPTQEEEPPTPAGSTTTQYEHGGSISPNSNNNDVGGDNAANTSPAIKREVKDEGPSTDDEAGASF